jgi:signal transduction histidine kinase
MAAQILDGKKMSESLRHAALCIIREATVNAIRHGKARNIAISGGLDGRRLEFSVVDDGRGFDPARAKGSKDGHFGLLGMRERAKAFNGLIALTSSPGNGTEVSVTLEAQSEN